VKTLTGRTQGGSTIAMQVAKHCLLAYGTRPARTWIAAGFRKAHAILLAWRLVKVEGRDNVLEYYLNHASTGPGLRGIGPAAWDYFRKKPHELSVGEAALIAVLLRSPGRSPRHAASAAHYETARQVLLQRLYKAQVINAVTYEQALHPPTLLPPVPYHASLEAPQSVAAAFRAIDRIFARFGLRSTPQQLRYERPFPLRLRVSLHTRLSQWFDEAMAPTLQDEELRYAALLLVDGRPVVLRGGELDLFHYAFQARRQVGSVSKLFFYESVWQLGYVPPDALVSDGDMSEPLRQRLVRPLYQPRNDDGRLRAPLPHSQALSHSVNKIAYRTTWGERTEAQRYAIARLLVERFGLPWQHGAQRSLRHFYRVFTADETVSLGTWQATPFEVAAMLEKGFRGSHLTPDQLILTWNGKPLAPGCSRVKPGSVPGPLQSSEALIAQAHSEACCAGLRVLDAFHIATAKTSGAKEFITTERPTTALFRVIGITITSLRVP
jgi:membrane peptidoglycan carboxypeptidase